MRQTFVRLLGITGILLLFMGACKTAPTTGYQHFNVDLKKHLTQVGLGAGDVFEVRVFNEKNLSGTYRVSPNGTIDFPLIGRVSVDGKTPGQITKLIHNRLMNGFIKEPSVSVFVKEYNSKKIFVLGHVFKPGTFPFAKGMTVVEAITRAGGFKSSANPNYVVVTRKIDGKEKRIPVPVEKISAGLAANLSLQAGDIVFVPDRLL